MFVQIPGYSDYLVDENGTVVSTKGGEWFVMKPHATNVGYLRVKLSNGPHQRKHSVHKLVMTSFVGPVPEGKQINHKDGDKTNNTLSNLEYVTPKENIKHAHDTGLRSGRKGERHHNVKVSDADAAKLLALKGKVLQREAAAMFGISRSHVAGIWSGRYRNGQTNTETDRGTVA